jgi:hypothetical protein
MTNEKKRSVVVQANVIELGDMEYGDEDCSPAVAVIFGGDAESTYKSQYSVAIPLTRDQVVSLGACIYRKVSITITVEED